MISNISKIITASGLLALSVASVNAGGFYKTVNSNSSWSGTVVIPSAGGGAQILYAAYSGDWVSNSGPLGSFFNAGPMASPRSVTGPMAAGTYSVSMTVYGQGQAALSITW